MNTRRPGAIGGCEARTQCRVRSRRLRATQYRAAERGRAAECFFLIRVQSALNENGRRRERRLPRSQHQSRSTNNANVGCLRALLSFARLELDLRPFGETLEALAGDAIVVDEQILAAIFGRNEPVALVIVKPLDGSGCHKTHLPAVSRTSKERWQRNPVLVLIDLNPSAPRGVLPLGFPSDIASDCAQICVACTSATIYQREFRPRRLV